MPQLNPKRTWYAIPVSGAAPLVIRLTTWAKYVEINEDPALNAGVPQGLLYNALTPHADSTNITKDSEPQFPLMGYAPPSQFNGPQLAFGDKHNVHSMTTGPLGNPGSGGNIDVPGGRPSLGTPLVQLTSNTATATGVIVTEYV